ncbi:hypothetical protein R75461_02279 [Paraburkholderia nemoris]|uniref:DUF802 domain-containing protein n=1 Tax=Paraburkholderia nemoris TaxID=2793076 RepID=UPI00190E2FB7|nr:MULTISPECIES: DUF802 domain-containing protein [Paraburkholderia]MBK3782502.1 DUF802 domain-containing protein [Paraburkholderia aspalathi]CAE6737047.1 hypothetical protein R75461_02279 [Paraburkholderia nemoris]CAE6749164.1 hypothetical protein LMG22931_03052 [Paraburkholderia nemoris]
MSRYLNLVVFLVGLAAVCWIGGGYVGSNVLALAVTLLIGACYLAGALELRRYSQATSTLARAVAGLSGPPPSLGAWLEPLHPSLRNAVRLRVEGERVALPGPALTPYLVGLLVLLGMLGTLLGMVATLRGTGLALESATDLQAIRDSLGAPVKGLGFAFGTSIAGVATSAMLGLLSALCRRERIDAAQMLDVKIATTLRIYSQTHQREESFKLLQRQAEVMPTLVERLQAMMTAIEQQSLALNERQIASQEAFHGRAEATYTRLAASVEQSLKESVAESTRAASAALQPVMAATLAGLARETAAMHDTVTHAVQQQLDGLSTGFEASTSTLAGIWSKALEGQQRSNEALTQQLGTSLDRFTETFEQRSAGLLDGVSARLEATAGSVSAAWNEALSRQEQVGEKLAGHNQQALAAAAATFEQHSASLLAAVGQSNTDLQTELAAHDQQRLEVWTETLGSMAATLNKEWEQAGTLSASRQQEICDVLAQTARDISAQTQAHASSTIAEIDRLVQVAADAPKAAANLQAELAARDQQRLEAWTAALGSMAATLNKEWEQAGTLSASRQQEICETLAQTARDISAQTQAHASSTIAEIDRLVQVAADAPKAAANLQAELAARDQQRLAAWTETLGSMAATLTKEWEQVGTRSASRQQEICDTLAQTARDISAQTQAHASSTIAEIGQLVQAASEAPKAAAEVVAELRQKLSDSMVRDTAMLDERSRLLATLETLLDAVNHASTEQRTAVDALVATSADLLDRVGTRFTDKVELETGKLGAVAAQVTGSAVEVASLGEAFGAAVQVFGESNTTLVAHLQRIEAALDKSLARSDEQLAYYVAQAREVIDLSMMSQKQIVEDLQHLAGKRASVGAEAA